MDAVLKGPGPERREASFRTSGRKELPAVCPSGDQARRSIPDRIVAVRPPGATPPARPGMPPEGVLAVVCLDNPRDNTRGKALWTSLPSLGPQEECPWRLSDETATATPSRRSSSASRPHWSSPITTDATRRIIHPCRCHKFFRVSDFIARAVSPPVGRWGVPLSYQPVPGRMTTGPLTLGATR
jgi:hypothetical protein